MGKYLAVLLSALMLLSLAGCAAKPAEGEGALDLPPTPSAPGDGSSGEGGLDFTLEETAVFYPEGSDEESAGYVLRCSLPRFSGSAAAEAMNETLQLYTEELAERVQSERLPLADRAPGEAAPGTQVKAEVEFAQGCTTLILYETVFYDAANTQTLCSTLVFNGQGQESSLYSLSRLYAPEELVAQQVWNVIDGEDPARLTHYGDLTLEDIRLALDLYNGFAPTEGGYRIYFAAGVLSDAAMGVQTVEFPESGLYPDFVGDILPEKDYKDLLPALENLSAACGAYYQSFDQGAPPAYVATAFMAACFAGRPLEEGCRQVGSDEYEALFYRYFKTLPKDLENGDGTELADGVYRIPDTQPPAFGLRLDGARREGENIVLTGMLYAGRPGDANTYELTALDVTLFPKPEGGYGFEAFSIR